MYSNKYLGAFLNKILTLVHQNEFQKANFQSFFWGVMLPDPLDIACFR